ncbi:MAG TPA: DUF5678 domain-containing protein [Candidatus Saccharimonadales bacterium]|nr:DUF5678 domain-containing protein [Candidatus Saccharimonadales bacterium]
MNLEFSKDVDIVKIVKIRDSLEWFYSNYEYFKKYYPGKHVAIKDQIVMDCDKNLDLLVERLRIKDYDDSIAIEFVYP